MSSLAFTNNKTINSKVLLNDLSSLISRSSNAESIEKLVRERNREVDTTEVINRLKDILKTYERKYHLSSSEFYRKIVGTPDDDTPDFINWAINYRCFCILTNKGLADGTV